MGTRFPIKARRGFHILGVGVAGGCVPPNMGHRSSTQGLYKSSTYS